MTGPSLISKYRGVNLLSISHIEYRITIRQRLLYSNCSIRSMAQLYYFTVFGLIVIIGDASATLIIIYSLNIIPMGNDPATLSRRTPKTKIA